MVIRLGCGSYYLDCLPKLEEGKTCIRQWVGYCARQFDPLSVFQKELVDMATFLDKPRIEVIPEKLRGLYHQENSYFKIFEEQWKCAEDSIPRGTLRWRKDGSSSLLYSEIYDAVMMVVKHRGLLDSVEKHRGKKLKEKGLLGITKTCEMVFPPEEDVFYKER
ncbi:hypothetical protein HYW76_00075 [Candidatus Pacearchaeota archaeon]|nr:hypothetical protein [Candidatus Pacearchaeota archaeon]